MLKQFHSALKGARPARCMLGHSTVKAFSCGACTWDGEPASEGRQVLVRARSTPA